MTHPAIDGMDRQDGADFSARDVKTLFGGTKSQISMELSGAYPLKMCKKYYTREVFFDKIDNRVLLTDTTDAENVILNFITYEKPEMAGNRIMVGTLAEAAFSGAELLSVEILPITDARPRIAWDHELYRIHLAMTAAEFKLEIK